MTTTHTFSSDARERLTEYLFAPGRRLSVGLGERESACSIAAVNLAITGELADEIPKCMSLVIGLWVVGVQDVMPAAMRNSERWKRALIEAVGTGNEHERERVSLLMDWTWGTVLPTVQPVADKHGFGKAWRRMCTERTEEATKRAVRVIPSTKSLAALDAASFAYTIVIPFGNSHVYPSCITEYTARIAAYAVRAICPGDWGNLDAWASMDPVGLLERLVAVGAGVTGEAV